MYKVYGRVRTRTFRVLMMLEEIGQPYTHVDVSPRSPEVLNLNPSGKIPVLVDGTAVLTDSTAILTYLADHHDALTWPAGSIERAHQDALTNRLLDEFESLLWTAARHKFVLPEERRCGEIRPSLEWEFDQNQKRLAGGFGGPFLMGERMTIADIVALHCFNWAKSIGFPPAPEPLVSYIRAMRARPSVQVVSELAAPA